MNSVISCRVCRGSNIKMMCIENIKLIEIYEKLTDKKFDTDGRPKSLCYICHFQLQKCQRFADMANKSEMILADLLTKGTQVQQNSVSMEDKLAYWPHNMSVSPIQYFTFIDDTQEVSVTVKNEQCVTEESTTNFEFLEIEEPNGKDFIDIKYSTGFETAAGSEFIEFKEFNYGKKDELNDEEKDESIESEDSSDESVENEFEDNNDMETADDDYNVSEAMGHKKKVPLDNNGEKSAYHCDICKKKFPFKYRLVSHLMLHSEKPSHSLYYIEQKPNACDQCTESFLTKTALKFHMKTHKIIEPDIFETPQSTLIPVVDNKPSEKPFINETFSTGISYSCKICDRPFPSKLKLASHILTHSDSHKEIPKLYKKVVKPTNLTSKVATKIKLPYSCNRCFKDFPHLNILETHMKTHAVKKYTCKTCNKVIAGKANLKRHMEIHDAKRPSFPCLSCNKVYSHKCHLTEHIRTHNGVKPHICKICNRTFTYRSTLTSHMVTHTGEKPYACTKCDLAFSQNSTLKRHLRLMH